MKQLLLPVFFLLQMWWCHSRSRRWRASATDSVQAIPSARSPPSWSHLHGSGGDSDRCDILRTKLTSQHPTLAEQTACPSRSSDFDKTTNTRTPKSKYCVLDDANASFRKPRWFRWRSHIHHKGVWAGNLALFFPLPECAVYRAT